MSGFLKRLFFLLTLAALTAAGVLLWQSGDPVYTLQSWRGGTRFWAYDELIVDTAAKHGLDPLLLKAIVWRESAFHTDKVGKSGERGLMQVGDAAALDWAKAGKIETFVPTDLFDAKTNLDVGAWYFKKALERWKSKTEPIPFALAEYNAGRSRVDRWIAASGRGESAEAADLIGAMDFPTTRRYIDDIIVRHQYYLRRGRM